MSERGGSAGAFMLGVAVGMALGLLFAPGAGGETRAHVARRLRNLRDLAGDKADELKGLLESGAEAEAEAGAARRDLERRLVAARERRRSRRVARHGVEVEGGDEPVA